MKKSLASTMFFGSFTFFAFGSSWSVWGVGSKGGQGRQYGFVGVGEGSRDLVEQSQKSMLGSDGGDGHQRGSFMSVSISCSCPPVECSCSCGGLPETSGSERVWDFCWMDVVC